MRNIGRLALVAVLSATGFGLLWADTPEEKSPLETVVTAAQKQRSMNNVKQIAIAFFNYHDAYTHLPEPAIKSEDGKPLLSWRVAILPFIGEYQLFEKFKLDEPWDSEHNKKLLSSMPKLYEPVRGKGKGGDETYYRVFSGGGALFDPTLKTTFDMVTDGLSNTIMVVEAGESVPWTKPEEIEYDPKKKVPDLGGLFDGQFYFAMGDGSVRSFNKGKKDAVLHKLITRSGGEEIEEADRKP